MSSKTTYSLRFSYSIRCAFITYGQWLRLFLVSTSSNFLRIYTSRWSKAFFLVEYFWLNFLIANCLPVLIWVHLWTWPKLPDPIRGPTSNSPHKIVLSFAPGELSSLIYVIGGFENAVSISVWLFRIIFFFVDAILITCEFFYFAI